MEKSAKQIRAVLRRHNGSIVTLARVLKVNRVTVSNVLRGKSTSDRILGAARFFAQELEAKK